MLRAVQEHDLLHGMCQVIVNEGGYRLAHVAFAQHDVDRTLSMQAYALGRDEPAERQFFDQLQLTWADTSLGQHAGAIAVRSGEPCIGRHLLTDPGHAPWRADALRLGYSSLSAFPLVIDASVAGVLIIADSDPEAFDADEVRLLGELSEDLAYGIANQRNRILRQEAEASLARTAFVDALTGLPNRALFHTQVQTAIDTARHGHRSLAAVLLSATHLHEVSDILGYQQAELLTCSCARQLEAAVREGQFLACVGEGEFALLLPETDVGQAVREARELVR
ncbi:hypothetical protein M622_13540 [Thauera terpenica 58Eu]|uniref:GGDEF domain-containing protein n=1 Tax=Thauera terpenica 58Eu TaxID=1348657 RepID=S9ZNQ4_9RHOO|nr:diguanylate cyclase [Thauera terpenica]EPZ16246.1 hypothetical protein M622_13540 [Thauera terpenica 58Eu]